jgi:hypothetical protein
MKVIKLAEDVYVVKDFVDKKYIKMLLKYYKTISEEEWHIQDAPSNDPLSFWQGKDFMPRSRSKDPHINLHDESLRVINYEVLKLFHNTSSLIPFYTLSRIPKGYDGMAPHRDCGEEGEHSNVKYGLVLYINDGYEGGEVFYPELNMEYKPVAGDLLIHSGQVLHGTNGVEKKDRFMITAFVRGTEKTRFIGNEQSNE